MSTTLKLETVSGLKMEVTGVNYSYKDGIHYLDAGSYPKSVVKEVIHE